MKKKKTNTIPVLYNFVKNFSFFLLFLNNKTFSHRHVLKFFSVKVWDLENMHSTNTYRGKKLNTFLIKNDFSSIQVEGYMKFNSHD